MTSRRRFLLGTTAGAAALRGQSAMQELSHAEPCMGTLFRAVAWAEDEAKGYRAIRAAFERAHALDSKLSDYREESELSALMRHGHRAPFQASDDLFAVVSAAHRIAAESDGMFDMTIGPLSRLWRESRRRGQLPGATELREAQGRVGHRKIHLDARAKSISLLTPGMRLDLGGIAKGFAADAMMAVLTSEGVSRAMVAAGGDIAVADPPPNASEWRVLVNPGVSTHGQQLVLGLQRQAASTSGAHEQQVTIDGTVYSHIVDPRTGLGLTAPIAVTVVAPTATESDALATAASVMGWPEALPFLARRMGAQGRIFIPSKEQSEAPERIETPGFGKLVRPPRAG